MRTKVEKVFVVILLLILIFFNINFVFATSDQLEIVSESAFLIDSRTEKVLFSKNENKKMYPASTTKIVTAILTLENSNLDDIVTVSYDAAMSIPDGYSTAYLQIGEQLTVHQLLQLLLVHSANDAANVLAEYIGGSVDSFVSMMNTKAHELNLSGTHFTNTYGKHDDDHYTTARDLATIMKYCIRNEDFRKLAGSASCAIPATNKYNPRLYTSTNDLIVPNSKNYYKYITCGKTGYTSQAGDCLVSCSYKDNLELICVILGGKTVNGVSTRFSETKNLFEFGYNNYSVKTFLNLNDVVTNIEVANATRDTKNLDLIADNNIVALVNNNISLESVEPQIELNKDIVAPIEQGDILGSVKYVVDGIVYKVDLVSSHHVEKSKVFEYVIQIGIAIIFLYLIYKLFFSKKRRNKRFRIK